MDLRMTKSWFREKGIVEGGSDIALNSPTTGKTVSESVRKSGGKEQIFDIFR